ncbi:Hypothetical predicted protein [Podarcis lilfordi]|uniref:Uncharacterized protein n=1 Tax=Podarcis lilfordi TaxID=74358 RepID=A0AA35P6F0_9SAUR|nr:Hypothetical predicted protein [Podarcis lilfordi]
MRARTANQGWHGYYVTCLCHLISPWLPGASLKRTEHENKYTMKAAKKTFVGTNPKGVVADGFGTEKQEPFPKRITCALEVRNEKMHEA